MSDNVKGMFIGLLVVIVLGYNFFIKTTANPYETYELYNGLNKFSLAEIKGYSCSKFIRDISKYIDQKNRDFQLIMGLVNSNNNNVNLNEEAGDCVSDILSSNLNINKLFEHLIVNSFILVSNKSYQKMYINKYNGNKENIDRMKNYLMKWSNYNIKTYDKCSIAAKLYLNKTPVSYSTKKLCIKEYIKVTTSYKKGF